MHSASRNFKECNGQCECRGKSGLKEEISILTGFHSVNRLKTCLNGHIWNTFVVDRLIYGLEVLSLKEVKDIGCLEKFQRKSLRQLQGLPDTTPNCVTLVLLGILPTESVIHKNSLNLFMNITRNKHFIEYKVAERQLVMKEVKRKAGLT